jgi:MerR family transcriptional regulator, redox-sensitive transcriptional activator SoxR
MREELSIGEVARRAGIRASAIRYYERVGVLPPARLVHTKRRYTPDIFQQLVLIQCAQAAGLTIAEIRLVLNPQAGSHLAGGWRELVHHKLLDMEQRKQDIERMQRILSEVLQREHLTIEEAIALFQSSN